MRQPLSDFTVNGRVIGSVEQRRNGVDIADIKDVLLNSTNISSVKRGVNGTIQKIKGKKIQISVNPNTGILIQTNPKGK